MTEIPKILDIKQPSEADLQDMYDELVADNKLRFDSWFHLGKAQAYGDFFRELDLLNLAKQAESDALLAESPKREVQETLHNRKTLTPANIEYLYVRLELEEAINVGYIPQGRIAETKEEERIFHLRTTGYILGMQEIFRMIGQKRLIEKARRSGSDKAEQQAPFRRKILEERRKESRRK